MGYGLLPMMAGVAELAGRGITATIAAGKSSYIGTCLASPGGLDLCVSAPLGNVRLCYERYGAEAVRYK